MCCNFLGYMVSTQFISTFCRRCSHHKRQFRKGNPTVPKMALIYEVADLSPIPFSETKPQMVPRDLIYWFPGFGFDSGPNPPTLIQVRDL